MAKHTTGREKGANHNQTKQGKREGGDGPALQRLRWPPPPPPVWWGNAASGTEVSCQARGSRIPRGRRARGGGAAALVSLRRTPAGRPRQERQESKAAASALVSPGQEQPARRRFHRRPEAGPHQGAVRDRGEATRWGVVEWRARQGGNNGS